MLGNGQGLDYIAVGKCGLHPEALIVDLAVLRGEDAYTVVRKRTADGAAGKAARQMHDGIALLIRVPFKCLEHHSRFTGDGAGDSVDIYELIHALNIEQDASGHGQSAAL